MLASLTDFEELLEFSVFHLTKNSALIEPFGGLLKTRHSAANHAMNFHSLASRGILLTLLIS